jgi:phosphoribosylanthranilate isomerase
MTRLEDVRAATELGVDAIGLVFWSRSPRCVTPLQALRLMEAVPPFVTVVGVFVDQEHAEVERTVRDVGLGAIQLHGDEPMTTWTDLPVPVVKAVGVDDQFDPSVLRAWPARVTPLLDARDPARRGGTGRRIDWAVAARAARIRPIVLAGGLNAETVGEAIRLVAPAAVDVSSGVEDRPGIKSVERIVAFMRALRAADRAASGSHLTVPESALGIQQSVFRTKKASP